MWHTSLRTWCVGLVVAFGGEVSARALDKPTQVNIQAIADQQIKIEWKREGYGDQAEMRVWRTTNESAKQLQESASDWTEAGRAAAKEGEFKDSKVAAHTDYWYTLEAVDGEVKVASDRSGKVYTGLPKPSDLVITPRIGFVELTWKHPGSSASFELQRRIKNAPQFEQVTKTTERKFSDPGAPESSFAAYRVRAVSSDGKLTSPFTEEEGALTLHNDWYLDPKFLQDNRYDPESINRISYCTFSAEQSSLAARWKCEPAAAVYISAEEVSTIVLQNLPPGVTRVTATLARGKRGVEDETQDGSRSIDELVFESGKSPSVVAIDLYKYRRYNSSFSTKWTVPESGISAEVSKVRARTKKTTDRPPGELPATVDWRDRASLIARSQDSVVLVSLQNEQGQTMALPPIELVYQRWWIDLGGFYAFRQLSDEEIVTAPLPAVEGQPSRVQVLRISDGHDWESDTGVMTTFFPSNYPMIGASFGIAENGGRALSYYLGGALRLRGKRGAAAATIAIGVAMAPVRRFPGVTPRSGELQGPVPEGANYVFDASSPLLSGEIKNELRPFAAITLGFALDRRSAKSAPKE